MNLDDKFYQKKLIKKSSAEIGHTAGANAAFALQSLAVANLEKQKIIEH